jgi:hypothetical protein
MVAVEAVSSQKVQYGGSWGSIFSKGSVWRQLGQYDIFSKVQYEGSWGNVSFSDRCTVCSMEVVMGAKLV